MGNLYISRTILNSVRTAIDNGISNKDIIVLVSWSGLDRIENDFETYHLKLNELQSYVPNNRVDYDDFIYLWKCLSKEDIRLNSIEHILMTQEFLKNNGVNFLFFSYQNLFSDDNSNSWLFDAKTKSQIYPDSKKISTIFDVNNSLRWISNMIDWSNWWFYKNEKISYGGIAEWISDNSPQNAYTEHDEIEFLKFDDCPPPGHPKNKGHDDFANQVLKEYIDKIIEK